MKLQALITDEVQADIDLRAKGVRGGLGRSGVTQDALDRYFYMLKRERTALKSILTPGELSLIADSCNGTMFASWSIPHIDHGVEDSINLDGLADKWEVDGNQLLAKLRGLTLSQSFALADAVEQFWANVSTGKEVKPGEILDF